jgi:hypothetical protein
MPEHGQLDDDAGDKRCAIEAIERSPADLAPFNLRLPDIAPIAHLTMTPTRCP